VVPDPDVIARDGRQPEFSRSIGDYVGVTAGPDRVAEGRNQLDLAQSWLSPIADSYRTGPNILIAIWGVESAFGRLQGDNDVIRSMATLAAEGRRRAFAESELIGALKILFSGEVSRDRLKGSWAGAMGQTQFTPLDYLAYAVDADGDGRRDIWGSAPDALGSTANFLVKKAAWAPGGSTQVEVALPAAGFDYTLIESEEKTPAAWAALGVVPAAGRYYRPEDAGAPAGLIAPMGWRGPAFLVFQNHKAIKAYNNSTSYALAVGLLASGVGGEGPLIRPWPQEQPLSLSDRTAAQQTLMAQGFYGGPADGRFGPETRKAARLWQTREGLPADGYLSYDLVQRLKALAPAAPPAADPTPPQPLAPAA
jgi:lytic murein transglycosylase